MNTLIKIDRLSAWVLFLSLVLYFISGYGMTKGIISPNLAISLHLSWLTYIVLVSFVFHTAFATRLALIRWQMWPGIGQFLWVLFYLVFIGGFIYIDRFYVKSPITSTPVTTPIVTPNLTNKITDDEESDDDERPFISTSVTPVPPTTTPKTTTPPIVATTKTFTSAELAKYNGQNNQPAYVAIDGSVYDVTSLFINGNHYSHLAGRDLSQAFYSYHAKSKLARYPIIGVLK